MLCQEGCGTLVPVADDVIRVCCSMCTLKSVLSFNNQVAARKVEDEQVEDDGSILTEDALETDQTVSSEDD
jgi:hypothetical protein